MFRHYVLHNQTVFTQKLFLKIYACILPTSLSLLLFLAIKYVIQLESLSVKLGRDLLFFSKGLLSNVKKSINYMTLRNISLWFVPVGKHIINRK